MCSQRPSRTACRTTTFGYEVAVIIADGLRRMYADQEDVFYYITLMNENYQHPRCLRVGKTKFARAS